MKWTMLTFKKKWTLNTNTGFKTNIFLFFTCSSEKKFTIFFPKNNTTELIFIPPTKTKSEFLALLIKKSNKLAPKSHKLSIKLPFWNSISEMMKPSDLKALSYSTKNFLKIKWSSSNLEILVTKVITSEEKEHSLNYLVSSKILET